MSKQGMNSPTVNRRCVLKGGAAIGAGMAAADRNIIYALTNTGIYLLSAPALGKPNFDAMPVKAWALPHLNRGHDQLRS